MILHVSIKASYGFPVKELRTLERSSETLPALKLKGLDCAIGCSWRPSSLLSTVAREDLVEKFESTATTGDGASSSDPF